ncbi:MAG TPA: hypothetical protein VFS44_00735 [Gemmatimonadaceae bacterium]|nr:hypothetical protein [Gemmatimonadaceae bacterium]
MIRGEAALAALLIALLAPPLAAQGGTNAPAAAADSLGGDRSSDTRPNECYGFSFGEWKPPLDWAAAGHHGTPSAPSDVPPGPRGDASHAGLHGDSTIMLYPPWWPAGVLVRFTRRLRGDTLRGTATALVADGRVRAPTASILGWRVRCGAPAAAPHQPD